MFPAWPSVIIAHRKRIERGAKRNESGTEQKNHPLQHPIGQTGQCDESGTGREKHPLQRRRMQSKGLCSRGARGRCGELRGIAIGARLAVRAERQRRPALLPALLRPSTASAACPNRLENGLTYSARAGHRPKRAFADRRVRSLRMVLTLRAARPTTCIAQSFQLSRR